MPVITVSQLNNYIKRYMDQNPHLSDLWIKGEISNFKKHYSGHIYMTLKDAASSVRVVMFKSFADKLKFLPSDGSRIIAFGKVSVYESGGTYQLYAESFIPDGVGELYAAFEKMKNELHADGLFDEKYKKPIPPYPQKIGVLSSISGAALRDIMNVISRRYRLADVCIYPVKVQGIGASDSICDGLKFFSENKSADVIILARGGGSIEDLWAFNEEKTARAIFDCPIPVISGVGHETDYTIADFVCDLRAPTPSAAAELATPSEDSLKKQIEIYNKNINFCIETYIDSLDERLDTASKERLSRFLNLSYEKSKLSVDAVSNRLSNAFVMLSTKMINRLSSLSISLNALDPKMVLKRGYTIVTNENGASLRIDDVSEGDTIRILFEKGHADCIVREVKNEN